MEKIAFNDQYLLTQAVLDDSKTMTRRIVTCPKEFEGEWVAGFHAYTNPATHIQFVNLYDEDERDFDGGSLQPKYTIGEIVAVAQSYEDIGMCFDDFVSKKYVVKYGDNKMHKSWRNKNITKAEGMPYHIQITGVRVECLQDISDEDCLKEGVELNQEFLRDNGEKRYFVRNFGHWRGIGCTGFKTPREAFAALIDKMYGKGTWGNNPWVWVYEFNLIRPII